MAVEESENAGAAIQPGQVGGVDRRGMLVALEVAGAQALDGDELVLWMRMVNKVTERPESLSAIATAAGGAAVPFLSPKAKAVALWCFCSVLVYNFVVRDLLILLLKLENAPPPAITYESVSRLVGALFGF